MVLVDPDPAHFAAQLVSHFIAYDMSNHKKDDVHARNIIQLLSDLKITVDGCVTFWDDCGPLAALICELMHLNGAGYSGARTAKQKTATQ